MANEGTQEIGNEDAGSSELVTSLQADLAGQQSGAPAPAPGGDAVPPQEKPPVEAPKPGAAAPATPPAKPVEAPKPAVKPVVPTKPAVAPKPEVKPINPDDPAVTAPQLRKALKESQETHTKTLSQKEEEIRKLTSQMASFQGKRVWTDEDQKLLDKATQRQAELEADVYSRDYRQSPEFKTKYQEPFDKIWNEAKSELVGMKVSITGKNVESGEPEQQERTITEADIHKVVDAPANQRINVAKELFGEDRETILTHARELNLLRKSANDAVEGKQKNYQTEIQTKSTEFQKAQGDYQKFVKDSSEKFVINNPDLFTVEEGDTEAATAVDKGLQFVDSSVSGSEKMGVNERAARAALIRGMAASFPRLMLERTRLRAEVERLKTENAGFRQSDPGNAGEGGGAGGSGGSDEVGGSDDLVEKSLGAV